MNSYPLVPSQLHIPVESDHRFSCKVNSLKQPEATYWNDVYHYTPADILIHGQSGWASNGKLDLPRFPWHSRSTR